MNKPPAIIRLRGKVQHYDWGGFDFIPNLLGMPNSGKKPFAELWMGTHHKAPAQLVSDGGAKNLEELIRQFPAILGDKTLNSFGRRLPYLFKVLDVKKMLSIQAHPNKKQAEAGFLKENKLGIPLSAPQRSYKDDNHKPELMVALSEFWLLHGFRAKEEISLMLEEVSEFHSLRAFFKDENIYHLYKSIMELPQDRVDAILAPLDIKLTPAFQSGRLSKTQAHYWAAVACKENMLPAGHYDRGILSIFLFNLLRLQPGEGIFQAAGIPHAYLQGINMELMANSDNVFRGGLTKKHIDVVALMKNLSYESVKPEIIQAGRISETERIYSTPAPDFKLSRIELDQVNTFICSKTPAPDTLIVMEGKVTVNDQMEFKKGEIFFAIAGSSYHIRSRGKAVLFRASVP